MAREPRHSLGNHGARITGARTRRRSAVVRAPLFCRIIREVCQPIIERSHEFKLLSGFRVDDRSGQYSDSARLLGVVLVAWDLTEDEHARASIEPAPILLCSVPHTTGPINRLM